VTAIVAAYNEADIVAQTVGDLIAQGVQVYFIDHGSTDGTVERVRPFLGHGVVAIEQSADTGATGLNGTFDWAGILRRKEQIAAEIDSDWFIHHDADEFRESPWPHLTLAEAIGLVDRLGYNAIDFELLNFWPTEDTFTPDHDVREAFRFYERGEIFNRFQVRCWKKTAAQVDLATLGGHDVQFEGRLVFPLRFLLRHYPIRSQAHGERKVFAERGARFSVAEQQRGWHVQYRELTPDSSFIRDPATLTRYDADAVRLELMLRHRAVEALEAEVQRMRVVLDAETVARASALKELKNQLDEQRTRFEKTLASVTADFERTIASLRQEVAARDQLLRGTRNDLLTIERSRSFRWMAPARALARRLRKLRQLIAHA
jgi:hypothetical protein